MELREYGRLVARWWWLPTALAVIVAGLSLAFSGGAPTSYQATVRFLISVPPHASGAEGGNRYYDPYYYAFLSTEYLVDDYSEFVTSQAFARLVAAELNDPSITVGMIQQAQRPEKSHRVLSVTVTTSNPKQTEAIASAIGRVLQQQGSRFLAQYPGDVIRIEQIDNPVVTPVVGGMRRSLELAVRVALAIVVGVALALVLESIDPSIRDAADVERLLGIPVLGEIPGEHAG